MTHDIFDNTILCQKCGTKMQKAQLEKNGFLLRAVVCQKCGDRIIHPVDEQKYGDYVNLKNKEFKVKMRLVGNSYAVSIPREIVSFMEEQSNIMDNMVKLCFQDAGRVSLDFGANPEQEIKSNSRVVKAREYKVIKNNKPVIHIKQFSDSANPKNNKTQVFKNTE